VLCSCPNIEWITYQLFLINLYILRMLNSYRLTGSNTSNRTGFQNELVIWKANQATRVPPTQSLIGALTKEWIQQSAQECHLAARAGAIIPSPLQYPLQFYIRLQHTAGLLACTGSVTTSAVSRYTSTHRLQTGETTLWMHLAGRAAHNHGLNEAHICSGLFLQLGSALWAAGVGYVTITRHTWSRHT